MVYVDSVSRSQLEHDPERQDADSASFLQTGKLPLKVEESHARFTYEKVLPASTTSHIPSLLISYTQQRILCPGCANIDSRAAFIHRFLLRLYAYNQLEPQA